MTPSASTSSALAYVPSRCWWVARWIERHGDRRRPLGRERLVATGGDLDVRRVPEGEPFGIVLHAALPGRVEVDADVGDDRLGAEVPHVRVQEHLLVRLEAERDALREFEIHVRTLGRDHELRQELVRGHADAPDVLDSSACRASQRQDGGARGAPGAALGTRLGERCAGRRFQRRRGPAQPLAGCRPAVRSRGRCLRRHPECAAARQRFSRASSPPPASIARPDRLERRRLDAELLEPGPVAAGDVGHLHRIRLSRDISGSPGSHSMTAACRRPSAGGSGEHRPRDGPTSGRPAAPARPACRRAARRTRASGRWSPGRRAQRTMASATSSTQTGWKRAAAPASGITGSDRLQPGEQVQEAVARAEDDRRPQDRQRRGRRCCSAASPARLGAQVHRRRVAHRRRAR